MSRTALIAAGTSSIGTMVRAEATRAVTDDRRIIVVDGAAAQAVRPRPSQHMTKRQIRQFKREARARAYQNGGLGGRAAAELETPGGDRARAALDKRARKAAKRAADAGHFEIKTAPPESMT